MKNMLLCCLLFPILCLSEPITYFMTTASNWDGDVNMVLDIITIDERNKKDKDFLFCKSALEYKQQNLRRQSFSVIYLYFYKSGGIRTDTLKLRDITCEPQ